jgi:type I restriction enzyme S subunit
MNMKPGFKQTELGLIPADWIVRDLGSLIESSRSIRYGIVQPGKSDSRGRYMVRGQDYSDGWSDPSELFRVSPAVEERYANARIKTGDILITIVGASTGRVAVVPSWLDGANITQTTARVAISSAIASSSYCSYVLSSWYGNRQVQNYIKGGAQPGLNCSDIEKFLIPLPPSKAEQQAIAEALSDVDALIESLEQFLIKKREIKQGTMQELLSGKRRLLGFKGKWEVKELGKLASIQRGASPRPIDSPIWFDEKSSVGWVRISDVTKSGMYLRETLQRFSTIGIQHSRPVARDSLIMSICATVGRPIITEIDTCIHDGFVVFDHLQTDMHFLYYMLRAIEGDWSRYGQTGSQMNLNTGLINRTEVPVPPTGEEQRAIATILADMDAEITALESKLDKARQIKQGMMQELLTGRIRLV